MSSFRIVCSDCGMPVRTSLLSHYKKFHPRLYWWATHLNVGMKRKKSS